MVSVAAADVKAESASDGVAPASPVTGDTQTMTESTEDNTAPDTTNSKTIDIDPQNPGVTPNEIITDNSRQARPTSDFANDHDVQMLIVIEPFIELHTGPGVGYPVFHVIEQAKTIQILKRKTDWFKVRTQQDITGWVSREQIEKTLTQAGVRRSFKDVLLDDYLASRLEFGVSGGLFENDQSVTLRGGYRFSKNVFFELAYTKIAGKFSSSTLYQANIYMQLYADTTFTPLFLIGYGKFQNVPASTLVNATDQTLDMGNAGIGLKYYLTDRFYFRVDATTYVVLVGDNRSDEYTHYHGGFSFFF